MQYKYYRYTERKDPPKSIWREKERLHGWDDPAADPDPCVLVLFPEVVHWCPYSAIPWWGSISGMPLFGPSLRRVVRDWHGKLERKLALKWAGFGLESQVHSRIMGKSWTLPILSFFFSLTITCCLLLFPQNTWDKIKVLFLSPTYKNTVTLSNHILLAVFLFKNCWKCP